MIKKKDENILQSQIEFSTNGNATVKLKSKEIFIHKKNTLNSLHLDDVVFELIDRNGETEAKVLKVLKRFKQRFVGKVHKAKNSRRSTFVIPDNRKIIVDFYIRGGLVAEDGDKVLVEFSKWDKKSPQGTIVEILGKSGDNNAEMNSIMYEYNLPIEFPKEVEEESEKISEKISEKEISKRRDIRGVTTFTIDPDSARDFDDALSVNIISDNEFEIGIHIADVSHYVKEGTELDKEAIKRATSVYLVDRVIPMLPERLSNGVCSLVPNKDRLAFSVIFKIDKNGDVLDEWFGKTIIHSNRRFTYEQAQEIIEGNDGDFDVEVRLLDGLAKKIRKNRMSDGSIEINGSEVGFKLDKDGKPIGVYSKIQKDSNKLIEEFMLLANKSVAKLLSKASRTNIYRIHDEPTQDKLEQLSLICKDFGYEIPITGNIKKKLNSLLKKTKGEPEENMIETLVTRSMSKAKYTINNTGHYGLGFTHYSHFTSPIRRYPDLKTHIFLNNFLERKPQSNPVKIEEIATHCSLREIAATKAQRDSIKYKQVEYLQDKVGRIFDGVISSVTDWGIYVELVENKCVGMVRYQSLEGRWDVNLKNHTVSNKSIGKKIRLGDEVQVIVSSTNLERKQIEFGILI